MARISKALLQIGVILGTLYVLFYDYMPPRTPRKVTCTTSGLKIPVNVEGLYFEEHWGFTDGHAQVALKLPPESSWIVDSQTKQMGYQPLKPDMVKVSASRSFTISPAHSTYRYELKKQHGDFLWLSGIGRAAFYWPVFPIGLAYYYATSTIEST